MVTPEIELVMTMPGIAVVLGTVIAVRSGTYIALAVQSSWPVIAARHRASHRVAARFASGVCAMT